WPDSGRNLWRGRAAWWQSLYTSFLAVPIALSVVTVFSRRTIARHGLLALHVIAIVITAALYFGDTRLRAPYDPILILLAMEVYTFVAVWLWTRGKALWSRRRASKA